MEIIKMTTEQLKKCCRQHKPGRTLGFHLSIETIEFLHEFSKKKLYEKIRDN
jgi:hypothetical protein